MSKDRKLRLKPIHRCTLGDIVAENDHELREYYVHNEHYEFAESVRSTKLYFIGRKGSGKSAILQMLRICKPKDAVVDLSQQDIGLDLLSAEDTLRNLPEPTQRLVFRSLWKAALMVAIHESIGQKAPTFKKSVAQKALKSVKSHVSSLGTATGLPEILRGILSRIEVELRGKSRSFRLTVDLTKPETTELFARMDVLRDIHTAGEHFGDLLQEHDVYVLLDDLDRSYENLPIQNAHLSGLFDTIENLNRIHNVKFVVSLRSDIFRNLDLQNPDKLVQHVHHLSWSPELLRQIVMQRIKRALDEPAPSFLGRFKLKRSRDPVIEIIAGCLPHPRDVIWTFQALLDAAADQGRTVIDQAFFDATSRQASANRVRWLCKEWTHACPWLEPTLRRFVNGPSGYSAKELREQLATCSGVSLDYKEVAQALLEIGILGLKSRPDSTAHFFSPGGISRATFPKKCWFEIHLSLREALKSGDW